VITPQPFLKWVGGKRALLSEIRPFLESWNVENEGSRYFEPFLGAGAVLFDLDPNVKKFGNDSNRDLVEVYRVIKRNPEGLLEELEKHTNESDHFYKVRNWDREPDFGARTPESRAARFIYLNRTCFNGLYRVNSDGFFNVPFGRYKSPNFLNYENIHAVSKFLRNTPPVTISHGDYRNCSSKALAGDLVYFDPPYDPVSPTASFTAYNKDGFSRENQEELRDEATRLARSGVNILLSNSDTKFINDLYSDQTVFRIKKVTTYRGIGAEASARGAIKEVLISSVN